MAGSSPARAPMTTAAARPPAHASGGNDDGLAVAAGVGGGGGRAGEDADGAAGQGQQDGLGLELDADLAAGGAERAAQPDLRSGAPRAEMIMILATPIASTSSAATPRPRNRVSSAPLASAWAVRADEGWETETWLGFSGLAVRGTPS